jgi:PAS domain S-box-containing protein
LNAPGPKECVGLPDLRDDPLLAGALRHAQAFYAANRNGEIKVCSARFAELAPSLFPQPGDLGGIFARIETAGEEVVRSDDLVMPEGAINLRSRHFAIFDANRRTIGYVGIYEDLTALANTTRKAKEMEDWLQDVIRSSSDWIWSVDRNLNLVFVSSRISEVLDVPTQSLTGRYLLSLGDFDHDDPISSCTRADMVKHAPFRNRVFLMADNTGSVHRISLSGVPVFDDQDGNFIGYRGTGTDVTAKFKAESATRQANYRLEKTLESLNKRNDELRIALERAKVAKSAKGDFLSMMSHELKTPLNSIIGFSDAANERIHGPISTAYAEYFENIHQAGTHLLSIINDVLDTASMDQQDVTTTMTKLSVRDLAAEAASLCGIETHKKRVDVTPILTKSDLCIKADHLRARQILVNLIGNALKFTPEGGRIGVDVELQPDEMVAITVWDTGIGIPVKDQGRIFDKFYRVEQDVHHNNGAGTGLGLAIARHLARVMKGDLTLTSIPGEGSRFTLTLPVAGK